MRRTRYVFTLAAGLGLAFSTMGASASAAALQDTRVLVAPLVVSGDIDDDFGKDVAEKVREALQRFGSLLPIDEDEVDDFLDQYDLDADEMSPIEWRQLGSQMSASLVMLGTATAGAGGIQIEVGFIDPKNGDELPVDPFSVADDDKDEEAAEIITAALGEQIEYLQSIAFCSEYLATEQAEDALRNCNRALELNPSSDRAYYLRGRAHMLTESWGAAAEDLERAVSADPTNTDALQSTAFVYAQLGDSEKSLHYYQEYLNFNPTDAAVRLRIAFDLATAGGHAEAMEILQEGVERDPDNVDLLEYLGSVALNAGTSGGQVTDAAAVRTSVSAFERVLEAKGDRVQPTLLTNVVNAYIMIEDYAAALEFSDRALELIQNPPANGADEGGESEGSSMSRDEMLASVYSSRANIYSRTERYQEAADALERALELNPEVRNGHQRRALALLKAGDPDAAVASFRTAVQQGANPDEIANALFSQGYQDHFERGQYSRAISLFEVATEFAQAPDVAHQIHFFIGFGQYQRGTAIDESNADAEACGPARNALAAFQQVLPHLNQAGDYQSQSQAQIREAVDVQLYRQEQIIQAACER